MLSLRCIAIALGLALLAGCGGGLPIGPNRAPPRDPNILPPPSARAAMSGTLTGKGSTTELRLSDPTSSASCSGTYAASTQPSTNVPVTCSDGRKGVATISRDPAGGAPTGSLLLADGGFVSINFSGAQPAATAPRAPTASTTPANPRPTTLSVPNATGTPPPRSAQPPAPTRNAAPATSPLQKVKEAMVKQSIANFTANGGSCPCPDSRNASGQRCGADSEYAKNGRRAVYCSPRDITDDMAKQNAELL